MHQRSGREVFQACRYLDKANSRRKMAFALLRPGPYLMGRESMRRCVRSVLSTKDGEPGRRSKGKGIRKNRDVERADLTTQRLVLASNDLEVETAGLILKACSNSATSAQRRQLRKVRRSKYNL
jgi:hypothetical protein